MMGVVIWSNNEDKKAVFWCEDHGDLAYYDANRDQERGAAQMGAGDMVEFDLLLDEDMRLARNARVVQANVCKELQTHLKDQEAEPIGADNTAPNVVPLHQGSVDVPSVKMA